MKLYAYKCPTCRTLVYSRARHDMRSCPCGDIAVDGGRDYSKISFKKKAPIPYKVKISNTKEEVYDDWNKEIDKLGWIKPEDPDYPREARDDFEF